MKTQVIVNPASGRGSLIEHWPTIRKVFMEQRFEYQAVFTEYRGHAAELARRAVSEGFELIVAIGGDGLIHEVVNGLMADQSASSRKVYLGIIPCGTGGDLARSLGLPRAPIEAARQLARSTFFRELDVGLGTFMHSGRLTRRFFANVAGLGFDAAVVERTEHRGKFGWGTVPYLIGLLTLMGGYQNKEVSLNIDHQVFQARINSVFVCNGRFFGGGMQVAPAAQLDDGQFDVVVLGDLKPIEILWHLPKLYRGKHVALKKVSVRRARTITIEPVQRMLGQADGELVGEGPATLEILPAALRLYGCRPDAEPPKDRN
jgi:diacylglycerol kinase (ATP)